MGGFSLMLGRLRRPGWQHLRPTTATTATTNDGGGELPRPSAWEGLAVVSNRAIPDADGGVAWLCRGAGETHALSNARYAAAPPFWPKVQAARDLVAAAVSSSPSSLLPENETPAELRARLLAILSRNTLPARCEGEGWGEYVEKLRESIFVPVVGRDEEKEQSSASGAYGTQKQSVVLVDWEGNVSFFERTLFDERGEPVPVGEGDREFEFRVEGWDDRD
jgi:hypothetical protein